VQDELDRIIEKTFLSDHVTSVCDICVFSCYTGLAYADVKKLTRADIVTGIDGEQWIYLPKKDGSFHQATTLIQFKMLQD
jgi:hypothetical protein